MNLFKQFSRLLLALISIIFLLDGKSPNATSFGNNILPNIYPTNSLQYSAPATQPCLAIATPFDDAQQRAQERPERLTRTWTIMSYLRAPLANDCYHSNVTTTTILSIQTTSTCLSCSESQTSRSRHPSSSRSQSHSHPHSYNRSRDNSYNHSHRKRRAHRSQSQTRTRPQPIPESHTQSDPYAIPINPPPPPPPPPPTIPHNNPSRSQPPPTHPSDTRHQPRKQARANPQPPSPPAHLPPLSRSKEDRYFRKWCAQYPLDERQCKKWWNRWCWTWYVGVRNERDWEREREGWLRDRRLEKQGRMREGRAPRGRIDARVIWGGVESR